MTPLEIILSLVLTATLSYSYLTLRKVNQSLREARETIDDAFKALHLTKDSEAALKKKIAADGNRKDRP